MSESLRSLSDMQILANTDAIIVQERKLTLQLLVHLNEIERRKLHLKRGYGSMFDYCTKHLRLSEPAAVRRIRTARCLARFPELHELLESGEVNLSTVSMIARIVKSANKDALLARIRGKSKREVEAIVAEYEPRAVLPPDRVRTIVIVKPAASSHQPGRFLTVSGDGKESATAELPKDEGRRAGDSERSPAVTVSACAVMSAARTERRALIQFTAREALLGKLEKIRSIASHRLSPNASFEEVIEFVADHFIEREDPTVRHERRESRQQVAPTLPRGSAKVDTPSRHIPSRVRDQVFVRDQGRCAYVSPGGKRCNSTHVLQVDHVQPFARGGPSTPENLRLLCAQHNRLEAERLMGCGAP